MRIHSRKKAAAFALASAAWVAVLFFFSGQAGEDSGELSGWVTRALFGWLLDMGMRYDTLHILVRKLAHFGAFAVEGFLLAMAGMHVVRRRSALLLATGAGGALAVLNELHQLTAQGRSCSPADMLIDTCGVITGALAAAVILHAFSIYKKY